MNTKYCPGCEEDVDIGLFAKSKSRVDGLQPYCKFCKKCIDATHYRNNKAKQLARNRKKKQQIRDAIDAIKELAGCRFCLEHDPCCLDFHHCRGDKEQSISNMVGHGCSFEKVNKEVEKCTVICANCHRKLHKGKIVLGATDGSILSEPT
jgi:hypothetical protein